MHGSFDVQAVKKFYNFYDLPLAEDFSEGNLYDFSSTGVTTGATKMPKKSESVEAKHKKAKKILDDANKKMLEEFSEENLKRLELAQKLYSMTSERYEKEQKGKKEMVQYSESFGEEVYS